MDKSKQMTKDCHSNLVYYTVIQVLILVILPVADVYANHTHC